MMFPSNRVRIVVATKLVDFRNYAERMIMLSCWQFIARCQQLIVSITPHIFSVADVVEHCEHLVGSAEPSRSQRWRLHGCEGFEFFRWIGAQVNLGALEGSMAEPERDLPDVVSGREGVHRAGVTQHMRRNAPVAERWLRRRGARNVLAEDILEARSGHRGADTVEEEFRRWRFGADGDPGSDRACRLLPERQDTLASSFAHHMDATPIPLVDLIGPQSDQFRHAQAGRESEMQHGPVPGPRRRARVGRVE